MVDTLTTGLYETAGERLNNIKELQAMLERYEGKLVDSISLNKDTINYCLVVLTLLLSIYVPNMGAVFTEDIKEFDMFLFLFSSIVTSLPTVWLMCESIYALILLTNMTENFLTFKHYSIYKDEKGNVYREHVIQPQGLGYVTRVYDILKDWMPVIMTSGALTLLFYINNNSFSDTWWTAILFSLYSIGVVCLGLKTLFIFGHESTQEKEDNEKSIVGFLIHFFNRENLYNIDTNMSISSIVQITTLYNKTLRTLLEEQCKFYMWLDRIVLYDAWERRVERKLKYVRKLEEVIRYKIRQTAFKPDSAKWKKTIQRIQRAYNWTKNAEDLLLFEYEGYKEYDIDSLKANPELTVERAIGEKFRVTQDILTLEKSLFKIQNLQLKCKSIQRQSKAIVKKFKIDATETKKMVEREEMRRQRLAELKIHEKNEFWKVVLPAYGKLSEFFQPLDVEEHLQFIYGDELGLNNIDEDFPVKAKMIFFVLRIIVGFTQLILSIVNSVFLIPYYVIGAVLTLIVGVPWLTIFILRVFLILLRKREKLNLNDISNAGVTALGWNIMMKTITLLMNPPKVTRIGFTLATKLEEQYYDTFKKYVRMWEEAKTRANDVQRKEMEEEASNIGEIPKNQSFTKVDISVPVKKL